MPAGGEDGDVGVAGLQAVVDAAQKLLTQALWQAE